jgi:phage terminase large subunit GpA-like protein
MLRSPPQLTVSEWAERHRMLGTRASAEPGPWRTSRTPYLKDVMDALSAVHPARRVVFMKGAQVGATESGNNWLGYIMHHVPAAALRASMSGLMIWPIRRTRHAAILLSPTQRPNSRRRRFGLRGLCPRLAQPNPDNATGRTCASATSAWRSRPIICSAV